MGLKFIKLPNGKTITEDSIESIELIEESENNVFDIAKKQKELELIEKELEKQTSDKKLKDTDNFIMKMIKAKRIMENPKVKKLLEDLDSVQSDINSLTDKKTGRVAYKIQYMDKKLSDSKECQTDWFTNKDDADNWMTKIGIEVLSM